MALQPMATLPLKLEVLLKLKPGIPNRGCSPDPVWMRGRTPNGDIVYGKSPDVPTHRTRDFLGWAPLTHIIEGFRADW